MGMITVVQKGCRQVVADTFGRRFMDVPVAERRRCITGYHLRHVIEGIVRGITAREIRHYYGGSGAATTEHMMLLPRLPQNWLFTVREQYTVLGYAVHEICHQLYTEFGIMEQIFPGMDEPGFKATNPQKHLKAFWNAVEDYRIEKICRTLFPGFPNYIDVTRDHSARKFVERVANGEYTAANLSNPFFLGAVAVTWNGAELNSYRTQAPALALEAINPKLRDWVMSWSSDLAQVSIVMDSLDLARRMVDDLYGQMADRSASDAPPESDEPQQDDDQQDDDQQDDDQQDDDQQDDDQQDDDQQDDDQQDDTASDGNDDGDEAGDPGTTSADDDHAASAGSKSGQDDEEQDPQVADDQDGAAEDNQVADDVNDKQSLEDDDESGAGSHEDHVDEDDAARSDQAGDDSMPEEVDGDEDQAEAKTEGKSCGDINEEADDATDTAADDDEQTDDKPGDAGHEDDQPQQDVADTGGQDQQDDAASDDQDQPGDDAQSDAGQDGQNGQDHDDAIADDVGSDAQADPVPQTGPDTSSQAGTDTGPAGDEDAKDDSKTDTSSGDAHDGVDADRSPVEPGGSGSSQKTSGSGEDTGSAEDGSDAGGAAADAPDGTFQPEEPEDLTDRELDFDDGGSQDKQQKPPRPNLDLEDSDDEGDPEAADLDIDDIRKAMDKVEDPEAEDATSVPPQDIGQSPDQEGESDEGRRIRRDAITKAGAERYAALRASLGGPALRSAGIVRRMLQSRSTTRIARGREEGDLDFERVVGMALGDSSIYHQMSRKIEVNTAISLLLDNSWSMNGHALEVCQKTAIVLDQAVTGTRTAIEITGFTSEFMTGKVRLYQYRTFEQKGNAAAASLGNMTDVQKGGTPVAVPIYDAVRRLAPRPEERKLMIIVSDGEAEDPSESADAYAIAVSMGITVVGISIGSPQNLAAMREWCGIAYGIADVEELPQALTQIVQETMR